MSLLSNLITGTSPADASTSRRKLIVASIAVLLIVGSIYALLRPKTQLPQLTQFIVAGEALAEQTAKTLNNRGHILVLQLADNGQSSSILKAQRKAFESRLKELGGMEIAATEALTPGEQYPFPSISRGQFDAALGKHPGVDAVVSFIGLPNYDPQNPLKLLTPAPKIIAYTGLGKPSKEYLADGTAAAIIAPVSLPANTPLPKSPRERFEKLVRVYDATNYQSLPD